MTDTCWDKVEDGVVAVLSSAPSLIDWNVVAGESADIATDLDDGRHILVWTVAASMDQFDEQDQSIHSQTIEIEFVSDGGAIGTLNRANKQGIALAHAALAADRTLGGMLQDLQEIDIAPARPEGKDSNGASVQYAVTFFTRRDDWFAIIGAGGAVF